MSFRGELRYSLDVVRLRNAFAAHIHCGAVGEAGPIGVTLFQTSTAAAFTRNGTVAHGPIEGPDLGNAPLQASRGANSNPLPGDPTGIA